MSELALLLVKATCLLCAGFLTATVLRRATAGARHAMWIATLSGLLLLPVAGRWLPVLALPWLPPQGAPELSLAPPAHDAMRPPAPSSRRALADTATPMAPPRGSAGLWVLWALYLSGVTLVLAHLAAGLWRVHRITRSARPPSRDSGWQLILDQLRADGATPTARPAVRILVSSRVLVPFTWGFLRPAILLPQDAESWPTHARRQVLLHELAHVARADWLTQTASRWICAVYWFHPLVWFAGRQLALEAERASDDHVLLAGASSSDYAEHLVALARRLQNQPLRPLAAVTIARKSQLPRRVRCILDSRTRRFNMTRSRLAPYILPTLTLTLLLASAQLLPAATVSAETDSHGTDSTETDSHEYRLDDPLAEALISAVRRGDEDAVEALLGAGAQADSAVPGDGNALISAADNGDVDLLRRLIATGADVNSAVSGDGSPLIAAAREGHLDATRLLVESGADVDQIVPGDENPLIQAAWEGQVDVVRYLIDQGADVHVEVLANGREVRSPLRQARRGGHNDVARLLIAAGAID